jgi:glucose-1-phosphate thymidylyltransferase
MKYSRPIAGLVPAAGTANRISPLPCSKEVLPIGFCGTGQSTKIRVAGQHLLENMRSAGANNAYIILRSGKWDIPAYFGNGRIVDMNLAYLITDCPFGVPFTLDTAYGFIKEHIILCGFPDILLTPRNAFTILLDHLAVTQTDIVLGLFEAHQPAKMDMVQLNDSGRPCHIEIKPDHTDLKRTWILAAWMPAFTRFLHTFVEKKTIRFQSQAAGPRNEIFLGHVINSAILDGLHVESVFFENGDYLDIGTPEDLALSSRFKFF